MWRGMKSHSTSEKILGDVSCTECTGQANDLELIPAVKIKTRHPIPKRVILVMNFRRSVIIAELWRPEVTRHWKNAFLRLFLQKWPLTGKFLKLSSERIHCLIEQCIIFKSGEISNRKTVKSWVAYLTKKQNVIWLPALANTRIAPNICRAPASPR